MTMKTIVIGLRGVFTHLKPLNGYIQLTLNANYQSPVYGIRLINLAELPSVIGSRYPTNCDFIVNENYQHDLIVPVISNINKTIMLNRWGKSAQQAIFHQRKETYPDIAKHLKILFTTYVDLAKDVTYLGGLPEGEYVIKPECGARSIGVMFADNNLIPFNTLFDRIRALTDKSSIRTKESTPSWNSESLDHIGDLVRDWNAPEGLRYTIGEENYPNEGYESWINQGICLQEFYGDYDEYRVIKTGTNVFKWYRRLKKDLIADNSEKEYCDELMEYAKPKLSIEVEEFFNNELMITGSIDVAFSKTSEEWVIFEISNQYSIRDYRPTTQYDIAIESIVTYLNLAITNDFISS